jgi:hypothetical protein
MASPMSGKIKSLHANVSDNMSGSDLVVEIDESGDYEEESSCTLAHGGQE